MVRISLFEVIKNIFECGGTETDKISCEKIFFEVFLCETIENYIDVSTTVFTRSDRIGLRFKMSFVTIAEYHPVSAELFFPVNAICSSGRGRCSNCRLTV